MSEQLKHSGGEQLAQHETAGQQRENLEKLQEAGKHAEREHANVEVDSLLKAAETHAISGKEVPVGEQAEGARQSHHFGVHKELKADAYQRMLTKTRQQLKAPDRVLSKIIHQPAIEAVSNVAAKTVARPSGILGGSIVALLGSAWLLYAAKHIGFTYNYLAFFFLLLIGFTLGVIGEFAIRYAARLRS